MRTPLSYIADSVHAPYGDKPTTFVRERSMILAQFLQSRRAKSVVIACNTATTAAASSLRRCFELPIVAVEPAIKPAAATEAGVIGVLATAGTSQSAQYMALLERFASDIRVVTQPCPGLVEQVETGKLDTPETRALLERYVVPLLAAGAKTIVLGCTHYPFLRPLIQELVGPGVTLFDTGSAVALQLKRVLARESLLRFATTLGRETFWTSGEPRRVQDVASHLWGESVEVEALDVCHVAAPLPERPQSL